MPFVSVGTPKKASKGVALVIAIFISVIAALIVIASFTLSSKNTDQITDDKEGKKAYYAAMAGLDKVLNLYNNDYNGYWQKDLSQLPLPNNIMPENLNNNTAYWVDSIEYLDSGDAVMVKVVGKSSKALRKIRARLDSHVPRVIDNFGLLTDGLLSISGDKFLKVNTHGNKGLSFSGDNFMFNNSTATQSSNKSAGEPDPDTKPVGGYIAPVKVPDIPIDYLREVAKSGRILYSSDPYLQDKINATPTNVPIYISGNVISYNPQNNVVLANNKSYFSGVSLIPTHYTNSGIKYVVKTASKGLTFDGDQGGRFIFVEGSAIFNADGFSNLSNMMFVATGDLTVNGEVDIDTSHEGEIDVVFASQGKITLNGSRDFAALFWTEETFTQNGSSIAGKVISRGNLTFNGEFTLEPSGKLHDNGLIEREVSRTSWQQIPMDE